MKDEHDMRESDPLTPEQDAELRSKVREAFDGVKLSEQSRESMLSALKQAQAEKAPEPPRKKGKPAARILRFVLPAAAACLALVAVVASVSVPSMMPANSPVQKQEAQSSEATSQQQGAQSSEATSQQQGAQGASSTANMMQDAAGEYESAALSASPGEWFSIVELSDGTRFSVTHDVVDTPDGRQAEEALAMNEDAGARASCQAIRIDNERCMVSFDTKTWYMATISS